MTILLAVTGIACCWMMRRILDYLLPGFSNATHTYWLYFFYVCAIPCFCALVPAWRIADNIGKRKAFCKENAKYMKHIGIMMAFDTAVIFVMNLAFFLAGLSFKAFFISFFLVFAIFFAITVCALALSSLLENASDLQNQSDFTI